MKLAFCLFKYFPYGGLQRDFLRILRVCKQRGHEIHVFTMRWEGEQEPGVYLHLISATGWQNHTRLHSYCRLLKPRLQDDDFDLVVGFNKIPDLDVYYAADVCYQARVRAERPAYYRLLPRFHRLVNLERAVFARGIKTQILLISPGEQAKFSTCYGTEECRFHLLPPGIGIDRIAPANAEQIRINKRKDLEINRDNYLLLFIGSSFKTKGLDRAMHAIASLPPALRANCRLLVAGKDDAQPFQCLATSLDIAPQVRFLGGRDDIPALLLAADILLHPAYHENTGTVLLEAMVAGLPVITVENCGYAHYISSSKSGIVIPVPFQQALLNDALKNLLDSKERKLYKQNGLAFAQTADIYDLPENAADFIENMANQREEFTSARKY